MVGEEIVRRDVRNAAPREPLLDAEGNFNPNWAPPATADLDPETAAELLQAAMVGHEVRDLVRQAIQADHCDAATVIQAWATGFEVRTGPGITCDS